MNRYDNECKRMNENKWKILMKTKLLKGIHDLMLIELILEVE